MWAPRKKRSSRKAVVATKRGQQAAMSTTEEVASPAAAVLARRQSRTTPQQKQVRKRTHSEDDSEETGSDSEWDPEQEDDPLRDTLNGERGEGEQEVRGRVRLHATPKPSDGFEADDARRSSLSERAFVRSVVKHGVSPSGAANFEAVPGREEYPSGDEGAQEWEEAIQAFEEDNFEDAGGQVRSLDYRDRKVGLFGDFLERVGHGKFVEWRPDEANGGLYKLEVVTKVRAVACCPPWACVVTASRMWQVVEDEHGTAAEVPRVPTWHMVMEYAVKASTGHSSTPKGGTPEYRNGPWYKAVYGKKQGDRMGKKKKYGYGSYAEKKTRFITIEQNLSAIRKYYDNVLKDTCIANPVRNARLEKVR